MILKNLVTNIYDMHDKKFDSLLLFIKNKLSNLDFVELSNYINIDIPIVDNNEIDNIDIYPPDRFSSTRISFNNNYYRNIFSFIMDIDNRKYYSINKKDSDYTSCSLWDTFGECYNGYDMLQYFRCFNYIIKYNDKLYFSVRDKYNNSEIIIINNEDEFIFKAML